MFFNNSHTNTQARVKSPIQKVLNASVLLALGGMSCVSQALLAQELSGVVVNQDGKRISNAIVELGHDRKKVLSNEEGVFSFTDINEGRVELHVSAKNYSHKIQNITVGTEDVTALNIVLSQSVMEIIDIQATPLHASSIESALPINVLSDDELKLKQTATLGETLKNEVGVHSSYYGPVSSSPIIRGLDGPRVLITQNGLDVGDASRVGPDHSVATETSTATQIEVLRGPATLFYGSGAIGGIVNIVDGRVPRSSDQQVDYLLQYNDVSNEKQASVNVQTGTEDVAIHVDAFWRDSKDYKLAGPAELEEEDHDEEDHDEDEEHDEDRLDNSAVTASGGTFGASYLLDQGFIGFSYGFMDREYGIPGHSHGDDSEAVSAKMEQDRWQMLGEYNFDEQFISKIATKFAYSDYQHQEIEAGAVGTIFTNESSEARFDIFHHDFMGWRGAWTVHYKGSDFEALGEEAFSPPSESTMFAAAWLEEKHFGPVLLQLGARVERVEISADASEFDFGESHDHEEDEHDEDEHEEETITSLEKQSFTPVNLSAGIVWDYQQGYNLGLSVALSQRAPSAAELFSYGPHIGTNTFEVGAMFDIHQDGEELHLELADKAPAIETSTNINLTFRKVEGDFGYVLSAFYNKVDDYYYQQDTGLTYLDEHDHDHDDSDTDAHDDEDEETLPVLIYQQDDVVMYGGEAEFVYQVVPAFKVSVIADYIRARLANAEGNDNLPRIPPMRLGTIMNYQTDNSESELSITRYFDQDDAAELETTTDGYTMLDAHINYFISGFGDDLTVYVKGQNLLNENARVHSSFLKDIAPLPGRNFSVGIRGSF